MQMAGLLKATVYMKPNHSSIVSIICGEDILFKALSSLFHGQTWQIFKVKMIMKISVADNKKILRKIRSNMDNFISTF